MKNALLIAACAVLISACEMPMFVTHTKKKDGYRQLVCTELICRHKRMMAKKEKHTEPHEEATEAAVAKVAEAIEMQSEALETSALIPEPTTRIPVFPDAVDIKIEPAVSSSLLFRFGKAELRAARIPELDTLANFLNANAQYRIGIYGHTDAFGNDLLNERLSNARAHTVASYLIRGGVAQDRVIWAGYGSARPIASNDTSVGREKNRRVEFIVNP